MSATAPSCSVRFLAATLALGAAAAGAAPLLLEATVAPGSALEAEGNDLFGYSIAIDDDTLVVGAYSDEVEIVPGQGESSTVGSVYVFRRGVQGWALEQRLVAADAEAQGWFGWDIAVRGNRLIVGAPQHDSPHPQTQANVLDQGAAYVYRRDGALWTLEQKLVPTLALAPLVRFGHAVALSDDTALVGAPDFNAGIVDVFHRDGTNAWSLQSRLVPSGGSGGPNAFGRALALHEHTALIGAPTEDNGGFGNPDSGVAYVFVRAGVAWTQQTRLLPVIALPGAAFGEAVALGVDRALVGARDETVNGQSSAGAVHDFRRTNTTWGSATRIVAAQPTQSQRFGNSVALLGARAAIASHWQAGASGNQQGAVHLFEDAGSGFVATQSVLAPPATRAAFNQFGSDIALAPGRIAIGEPGADGTSFNAGRGHVFVDDAGFVFADGFE